MMYKIHVEFGSNNVIDVESESIVVLHTMINETAKKFFPDTDSLNYDMKLLLKTPQDLAESYKS